MSSHGFAATQAAAVAASSAVVSTNAQPLSVAAGSSLISVVSALTLQTNGTTKGDTLVSIVQQIASSVASAQVLGSPAIVLSSNAVQVRLL